MSNEMIPRANRADIATTETLEQLAQLANVAHLQATKAAHNAVGHALEAGQALLEAKKRCPPGAWHAWLNLHFRGSIRTAQSYVRLAVHSPQIDYDAQRVAHLTHKQLRCLMDGLAATDGRAKPSRAARRARAALPLAPERPRCCPEACVPVVSVLPEFESVAEPLRQTLRELAEVSETQTQSAEARAYALHLFDRLRMLYAGLGSQRWFHDWQVNIDRS